MGSNVLAPTTRRTSAVLVLLALLLPVWDGAGPAAGAEIPPSFLSGVDDLPLMAGLVEDVDSGVVFDTPTGRIVEAYARGRVEPARVLAFYTETLPQLGWRRLQAGYFRRDLEELRIEFAAPGAAPALRGEISVRFALSPAAPAGDSR